MGLIKNLMENLESNCPCLILGSAVVDFKKEYEGPIRQVRNTAEVRELVSYYTSIDSLDSILVIEDLSFLNSQANFMLLKLVEESKFPVVLLSTFDNISPIMLSRIKTVEKYHKEKTNSQFLSLHEGINKIEGKVSKDSHRYDKIRVYSRECPMLYYFEAKVPRVRNREKLLGLID